MTQTITIGGIDTTLLKHQRDVLVETREGVDGRADSAIDGVINLLDEMLDIADGCSIREPEPNVMALVVTALNGVVSAAELHSDRLVRVETRLCKLIDRMGHGDLLHG